MTRSMQAAWISSVTVFLLMVAPAGPAAGQQDVGPDSGDPSRARTYIGLTGGFAQGSATVAGSTGRETGFAYGLQLGVIRNGRRSFALDVQIEPFRVPNLERPEHFASVNVTAMGYLGPVAWREGSAVSPEQKGAVSPGPKGEEDCRSALIS